MKPRDLLDCLREMTKEERAETVNLLVDEIKIEDGVNLRQAIAVILAASGGALLGAESGTVVIKGGNVSANRIEATIDAHGNRTAIKLTLPD